MNDYSTHNGGFFEHHSQDAQSNAVDDSWEPDMGNVWMPPSSTRSLDTLPGNVYFAPTQRQSLGDITSLCAKNLSLLQRRLSESNSDHPIDPSNPSRAPWRGTDPNLEQEDEDYQRAQTRLRFRERWVGVNLSLLKNVYRVHGVTVPSFTDDELLELGGKAYSSYDYL